MGREQVASGEGAPVPREERVRQILTETSAIVTGGHFAYKSGRHGDTYINKDAIYPHTDKTFELCKMWAEDLQDAGIETVVGPAIGGVILSHATASALAQTTGRDVAGVYAEKDTDPQRGFKFTRGYDEYIRGKRVLVVEDVLTTGGSAKSVVDLVRENGGEVIAVAAIANRGGVTPEDLGVERLDALIEIQMETFEPGPHSCKGCRDHVPINTKLGAGKNQPSAITTVFTS